MARGVSETLRCEPGGIVALAALFDAHRGAFEHDWRARFPGVRRGLEAVGTREMAWGEALRLTRILRLDSSTQVCSAIEDWSRPSSREEMLLFDLVDSSEYGRVGKKHKALPRPWDPKPKRFGNRPMSIDALRALLDKHRLEGGATDV